MKIRYVLNPFGNDPVEFVDINCDGSRREDYFMKHVNGTYGVGLRDCIPVINGNVSEWSVIPSVVDEITIVKKIPRFRFGE